MDWISSLLAHNRLIFLFWQFFCSYIRQFGLRCSIVFFERKDIAQCWQKNCVQSVTFFIWRFFKYRFLSSQKFRKFSSLQCEKPKCNHVSHSHLMQLYFHFEAVIIILKTRSSCDQHWGLSCYCPIKLKLPIIPL